ncbi:hypothetical protein PTI98_000426 [Pleurotus ostreatus]|nr:hypothetical protein PTI98_000426 [Pleurotus ostreatus]
MGVTVIYGSGNTGTAGATRGYCMDENGTVSPNGTLFNPAWPGSCPWITSVGGTQLRANSTVFDQNPEEVTSMDLTMGFFTSAGGGFSRRFPTPAYQNRAVQGYLKQLTRTDPGKFKVFNSHGRGYPDISVISNRYVSAESGALVNSSGVSGSSPVLGAMISLINDARLSKGKGPVGFINPAVSLHFALVATTSCYLIALFFGIHTRFPRYSRWNQYRLQRITGRVVRRVRSNAWLGSGIWYVFILYHSVPYPTWSRPWDPQF